MDFFFLPVLSKGLPFDIEINVNFLPNHQDPSCIFYFNSIFRQSFFFF